ncbi:MAG TPA: SIMPL domain-containing protein [Acidimicrobiia bacterium]|nr:SIMPL domain-containing protein [Acidimicrobiia bacterium]
MNEHNDLSGITVSGVGEVHASPDVMTLDLSIAPRAESVAEAAAVSARKSKDLLEILTGRGLRADDIRTIRYALHPEYDHRDGDQRLLGFRVTSTLRVKIRDLDSAGVTIDAAVGAGGDDITVDGVTYSVEDATAPAARAREAAWADAITKAEHLAGLADRQLGPVISIIESVGRGVGPQPLARLAMEADTPIAPGTSTLTVTLEARFGLE